MIYEKVAEYETENETVIVTTNQTNLAQVRKKSRLLQKVENTKVENEWRLLSDGMLNCTAAAAAAPKNPAKPAAVAECIATHCHQFMSPIHA